MFKVECGQAGRQKEVEVLEIVTDGKEIYYVCPVCSGLHIYEVQKFKKEGVK